MLYSPEIRSVSQVDAGTAYTVLFISIISNCCCFFQNRLFSSLNELVAAKEHAIIQENYNLAEQLRHKITAIQLQIIKTEHQFSADLISNLVTVWQLNLADMLSNMLKPLGSRQSKTITLPNSFPLHESSQSSFVKIVSGCPSKYYDCLIKARFLSALTFLPVGCIAYCSY